MSQHEHPERSAAISGPEFIARAFHEMYEALAPVYGWETQNRSAVEWGVLPEANKRLMVKTVTRLLHDGVIKHGADQSADAQKVWGVYVWTPTDDGDGRWLLAMSSRDAQGIRDVRDYRRRYGQRTRLVVRDMPVPPPWVVVEEDE